MCHYPHYDWEGKTVGYHAAIYDPATNQQQPFELTSLDETYDTLHLAKDRIRQHSEGVFDEPQRVRIWNPAQKRIFMEFEIEQYRPVAVSPDETMLARYQPDGVALFEVQTGKLIRDGIMPPK